MKLYAPAEYWQATQQQHDDICNGCGTKGFGGFFVPDTLYGLSINEACNIHDWMYFFGMSIIDKESADRSFLNNMLRIIDAQSGRLLKPLRRRRAMEYYLAVHNFGGSAFWAGKNYKSEMGVAYNGKEYRKINK